MAQLRREYQRFVDAGATIVVVGPEGPEAFKDYWEKNDLPFVGLPDPSHTVLKLYGQEIKLFKLGRMPAQVIVAGRRIRPVPDLRVHRRHHLRGPDRRGVRQSGHRRRVPHRRMGHHGDRPVRGDPDIDRPHAAATRVSWAVAALTVGAGRSCSPDMGNSWNVGSPPHP